METNDGLRARLGAAAKDVDCGSFDQLAGEDEDPYCGTCGYDACGACRSAHALRSGSVCLACIERVLGAGEWEQWFGDETLADLLERHEGYLAAVARVAANPSLDEV